MTTRRRSSSTTFYCAFAPSLYRDSLAPALPIALVHPIRGDPPSVFLPFIFRRCTPFARAHSRFLHTACRRFEPPTGAHCSQLRIDPDQYLTQQPYASIATNLDKLFAIDRARDVDVVLAIGDD
jgi:hypothetical protein